MKVPKINVGNFILAHHGWLAIFKGVRLLSYRARLGIGNRSDSSNTMSNLCNRKGGMRNRLAIPTEKRWVGEALGGFEPQSKVK